ncbi:MAG: hypothetical protein Q9186_003627 [Xanthomendoza sp. 1 TL-2023]
MMRRSIVSRTNHEEAAMFAAQVPNCLTVRQYVDLGCDSGKTASAVVRHLQAGGQTAEHFWLVDGLASMLERAVPKVIALSNHPSNGDFLASDDAYFREILTFFNGSKFKNQHPRSGGWESEDY